MKDKNTLDVRLKDLGVSSGLHLGIFQKKTDMSTKLDRKIANENLEGYDRRGILVAERLKVRRKSNTPLIFSPVKVIKIKANKVERDERGNFIIHFENRDGDVNMILIMTPEAVDSLVKLLPKKIEKIRRQRI